MKRGRGLGSPLLCVAVFNKGREEGSEEGCEEGREEGCEEERTGGRKCVRKGGRKGVTKREGRAHATCTKLAVRKLTAHSGKCTLAHVPLHHIKK